MALELCREGETNTSSIASVEQLGDPEGERQRGIVFAGLDRVDALARTSSRSARSCWLQSRSARSTLEAVFHQQPTGAPSVSLLMHAPMPRPPNHRTAT